MLALNPEHAEGHNNLGVVLKEQGRLDAAADAYRKAIALKPAHAEAHNNLGLVLLEQGLVDDAIRSFERALQAHPGYGTAMYNLGIAWIWREDRSSRAAMLRRNGQGQMWARSPRHRLCGLSLTREA